MATQTLSQNGQKITIAADTNEHQIDFGNVLKGDTGTALIEWVSGTSFQINSNGVAISSTAGSVTMSLNSTQTKAYLPIERNVNIRMKGGAGSEVFQIMILPRE
jgi:hypothetical protein